MSAEWRRSMALASAVAILVVAGGDASGEGVDAGEGGGARSRTFPDIAPPPLPPVVQFNQLIQSSPAERTNRLAGKTATARGLILRELQQFDQLGEAERERRILQLRVAQLRFYLRPILRADPVDRGRLLRAAPGEDRALLETRLAAWDALPGAARQEVLESEQALQQFVRQASMVNGPGAAVAADAPAPGGATVPAPVQQAWDRWQSLSPQERSRREENVQRFFSLTTDEQTRVLGGLPLLERQRMEHALQKFSQLPPARREVCVQNFDRLARLPEAERAEFLRNAARWEAMTQSERSAWRRLVMSVPPPPPMPPIPANVAGRP